MSLNVFSYGGGKQSTAVLVLAAQGRLQFDALLFSNVGKDSEKKATLRYFQDIARPFAAGHGLNLIELHRVMRDGSTGTTPTATPPTRHFLRRGCGQNGGTTTLSLPSRSSTATSPSPHPTFRFPLLSARPTRNEPALNVNEQWRG